MDAPYTVTLHDDGAPEPAASLVDSGIGRYNSTHSSADQTRPLAAIAVSADGTTLGGAIGRTWGACCELRLLWVDDEQRQRGVGRALMAAFEQRARERGCTLVYLDTFSFQAPAFYRALGYACAHEISGYAPGVVKYTMTKTLDRTPA